MPGADDALTDRRRPILPQHRGRAAGDADRRGRRDLSKRGKDDRQTRSCGGAQRRAPQGAPPSPGEMTGRQHEVHQFPVYAAGRDRRARRPARHAHVPGGCHADAPPRAWRDRRAIPGPARRAPRRGAARPARRVGRSVDGRASDAVARYATRRHRPARRRVGTLLAIAGARRAATGRNGLREACTSVVAGRGTDTGEPRHPAAGRPGGRVRGPPGSCRPPDDPRTGSTSWTSRHGRRHASTASRSTHGGSPPAARLRSHINHDPVMATPPKGYRAEDLARPVDTLRPRCPHKRNSRNSRNNCWQARCFGCCGTTAMLRMRPQHPRKPQQNPAR